MLPKPLVGLGRRRSAFLLLVVALLFCVTSAFPAAPLSRRAGADTVGAQDGSSAGRTLQRSLSAPHLASGGPSTAFQQGVDSPPQSPPSAEASASELGDSFRTAPTSERWTPLSSRETTPLSSPGDARALHSEGWEPLKSGDSPSPLSPAAARSEETVGRNEYPFTSSSSASSPGSAGGPSEIESARPAMAPKSPGLRLDDAPRLMQAQRLPDGAFDLDLVSAANGHVMRELKQTGRVIVSMYDPASVGGVQLYEYRLEKYGLHRKRLPVTTRFLEEIRQIETGARSTGLPIINDRPVIPAIEPVRETGRRGKLASASEALRKAKDAIAVGLDPRLERVYTTHGVPAVYGRTDPVLGKTIPVEARRLAQEFGEARVFYDPYRPWDQTKVVYRGGIVPKGQLAPESAFKTVIVPVTKSLPLPKAWQGHEDMARDALTRIQDAEKGQYARGVPPRWPTKLRQTLRDRWNALRTPATTTRNNVREAARPAFKAAAKGVWDKITAGAAELKNKVASWRPSVPSSDTLSVLRPTHL